MIAALEKDDPTTHRARVEAKLSASNRKHLVEVAKGEMKRLRSMANNTSTQITTDKNGRMVVMTYRRDSAYIRSAIDTIQKHLKAALASSQIDRNHLDAHDEHHDDDHHLEEALHESEEVRQTSHFVIGGAVLKAAKSCKHHAEEMLECAEHAFSIIHGGEQKSGRSLAEIEKNFTNPALQAYMSQLQSESPAVSHSR